MRCIRKCQAARNRELRTSMNWAAARKAFAVLRSALPAWSTLSALENTLSAWASQWKRSFSLSRLSVGFDFSSSARTSEMISLISLARFLYLQA
jgi:hypothetical protein